MPDPRPRILVADDQSQICDLVRDALRPAGYDVDVSHDGREVLERFRSGDYALLILDTLVVQESGLEVVTKLRNGGAEVPILLMYGPRKEPDRLEAFAFTCRVDLLRKPFGVGELRAAVSRALRKPDRD